MKIETIPEKNKARISFSIVINLFSNNFFSEKYIMRGRNNPVAICKTAFEKNIPTRKSKEITLRGFFI